MNTRLLLLLLLCWCASGCDRFAQVAYHVRNDAPFPVKTVYQLRPTASAEGKQEDTIIIAPNADQVIAVITYGTNRVEDYRSTGTYQEDFSRLELFRDDTLNSLRDPRLTDHWHYREENKHYAHYTLTVSAADF